MILSTLSLLLLISATWSAPPPAVIEVIDQDDLIDHVRALSDDSLAGRAVTSTGNDRAAEYIARAFQKAGLEPVSARTGYRQPFVLERTRVLNKTSLKFSWTGEGREHEPKPARLLREFYPALISPESTVSAPVVFAGYGISAPEFGWDDYKSLDVRGKVVLVLDHEPEFDGRPEFFSSVLSDYGTVRHKLTNGANHGAVAILVVGDEEDHSGGPGFSAVAAREWPAVSRGNARLQLSPDENQIPAMHVSRRYLDRLLKPLRTSVRQVRTALDGRASPELVLEGLEADLEVRIDTESDQASNILGIIPGSDPELKNEWVIVGAHFDHVEGALNRIFNGADDNASGTAALLELAQAFGHSPRAPRRSVLLAAWNAEEEGLLGSYYYVAHPVAPLQNTIAMLQMDMIGRDEEILENRTSRFRGMPLQKKNENKRAVNILGYTYSPDLVSIAREQNEAPGLDLRFRYDQQEQELLRRSDHWPFLSREMPVLFFHTGLHPDYHRPSDTIDKINFSKMVDIARLVFLVAWQTADSMDRPQYQRSGGTQ